MVAYCVVRAGLVVGELYVTRGRARKAADELNRGAIRPLYAVRPVRGMVVS